MKKKWISILALAVVIAGVIISLVVVNNLRIDKESNKTDLELHLSEGTLDEDDKDSKYFDYLAEKVETELKRQDGIDNCSVDIVRESEMIKSVKVNITKDGSMSITDDEVKGYVSETLGTQAELVTLNYKE